jgi:hypothetical protein
MSTNDTKPVRRATASGRLGKVTIGAGVLGVALAGTVAPAAAAPTQSSCRSGTFTHSYESRVDGNGTRYWFPNTSWSACNSYGGGLVNTNMSEASSDGAGRGYYRTGSGSWTFASATVKFTRDNYYALQTVISDLKTNTRFNHGHTVRYASVRTFGYQ